MGDENIDINNKIYSSIHADNILITRNNITCSDNTFNKFLDNLDTIDNFILVVDFDNRGGGTTFFLNTIISHYKNSVNFVIARNKGQNVVFNINEEILITKKYSITNQINFLEKNKDKIIKIFVNHTLGHDNIFINHLFTLEKEITTITHDYFTLFEKFNPFFYEIKQHINEKKLLKTNVNDINNYNKIILQNEELINIFKHFITGKTKICVNELPDFHSSGEKILIKNNDKIVVGIIGGITKKKGLQSLKNIIHHNINNNIEFIIFGKTENDELIDYSHPYNTIHEFNDLIKKKKPNILLETSVWPETYSYTLSMAMLTQLPILSIEKKFPSVIENRLSKYNKNIKFSLNNNIYNLIQKHKQNFFYTIDPVVYFSPFWDDYFIQNKVKKTENKKNLVIILSKIIVSEKPFSYAEKRSIYTPTERYLQTLEGINSIKKYIEKPYIILFDNSNFENNENIYNNLKTNVDEFINITDDNELNYCTDECKYKAFGEISQLLKLYQKRLKKFDYTNINNIFKISGRYTVNESFDERFFINDKNICKINTFVTDRKYWYTCFYKLNKEFIHKFYVNLKNVFNNKNYFKSKDLEVIFSEVFNNNFHFVINLGITQNIATWNEKTRI